MRKKNYFLMGSPGSGKSTILMKIILKAQAKGLEIAGILTPDIRGEHRRIGFFIENVLTKEKRMMAKVNSKGYYRVGRYVVYIEAVDAMSDQAILKGLATADMVCIDEIGKMELFSPVFKDAVMKALNSELLVFGSIGKNLRDPYVHEIIHRPDTLILSLNKHNRDEIYQQLLIQLGLEN